MRANQLLLIRTLLEATRLARYKAASLKYTFIVISTAPLTSYPLPYSLLRHYGPRAPRCPGSGAGILAFLSSPSTEKRPRLREPARPNTNRIINNDKNIQMTTVATQWQELHIHNSKLALWSLILSHQFSGREPRARSLGGVRNPDYWRLRKHADSWAENRSWSSKQERMPQFWQFPFLN
jgi:hypothetical protein